MSKDMFSERKKIDLHMHTTASDGASTPAELVEKCIELDLEVIAVTDHDNMTSVEEVEKLGRQKGLKVVPGIEISTYRGEAEYHILGYFVDPENDALLGLTEAILDSRVERTHKMIEKLSEMGYPLEFADVKKYATGVSLGRPHVARAMVDKGYIEEIGDAFTEEFIAGGGKAYVEKKNVLPVEAIEVILKADGIPVIAHPYIINHGEALDKEEIARLKNLGLKGVEVYQTKHNEKITKKYKQIAEELDLLITGGSDYHGENSPGILPGDRGMTEAEFEKLESYAHSVL
ncbi:PHP domain-containing protein [Halanaerobium saccharolyticum]|uniref:PHP domain-containing protein n=1 Tax=Halanaerobium saccharolyticum TaxID=43595 RepID=UPI003FCC8CDD